LSNLKTRILVAIVGIPLVVALTMAGGVFFFLFVVLISSLTLHEFYSLARAKGVSPQVAVGLVVGLCVTLVFMHRHVQSAVVGLLAGMGIATPFPSMAQMFLMVMLIAVPVVGAIEVFRNRPGAMMNIAATLFGICYASLPLGALVGLREMFVPGDFPAYRYFDVLGAAVPADVTSTVYMWGGITVVALFASIWICDSAAYFAGSAWGRNKLLPRVSPNKTWEGAVAGLVFAVLTFVAATVVLPYLTVAQAIICGLIVGVFGQVGDLFESLLKRDAGLKDSSALIPGHGGALDRFDSLIFASPLVFFYLDFVVFS
jgi:phosphatidate cytidylyltransferase